jgi:hypothetical protein
VWTCGKGPWPSAENEYRIPAYSGRSDPDLKEATLARAAELAIVAYDANAQPNQFLQGWLIQDRFLMRGTFGAPYEFLWANPYQPGLPYSYMPDLYHEGGRLLVRSSWDEDAAWFGCQDGQAQVFRDGRRETINTDARPAPLTLGAVRIVFASWGLTFMKGWLAPAEEGEPAPPDEYAYVLGLEPDTPYDVEVDDEEMDEVRTDRAGILELRFAPGHKAGVRVHKSTAAKGK